MMTGEDKLIGLLAVLMIMGWILGVHFQIF